MKKIVFILIAMLGISLQAQQDLAARFNPKSYAEHLSQDIQSTLGISDQAVISKLNKETYVYAQSIRKYLILFQQQGKLEGKTLEEGIQMVLPEVDKSSHFKNMLKRLLGPSQVNKLIEKGLIK